MNEPPAVTGNAEVTSEENLEHSYSGGTPIPENDPETTGVASTWSLSGTDSGKFGIADGALTFEAPPDFEMPGDANGDNVYEVTVVAADASGKRGTMDVKVTVGNVDEDGMVTLSRTQPRVGVSVKASLTDPDGSISGLTWQWYRGNNIMADALPPTECADDSQRRLCHRWCHVRHPHSDRWRRRREFLTAVAMYTDGAGSAMKSAVGKAANVVAVDTRNRPPAFVDQDTETDGVQNESARENG